jgi:hypothetical protein
MGRPRKDQPWNGATTPDGGLLNGDSEDVEQAANAGGLAAQIDETAPRQGAENPQQGAGISETAGAEGGGKEGGTDNAGDGKPQPEQNASSPPVPPKNGKRRVRHPGGKAKKVIAGGAVVEFDAEGVAEMDAEQAEYLLSIPGYDEIGESA